MGDKLTEKEVTSTEQYLLSCLLMDSDMYPIVKDIVKSEYFFETRHAYIFDAMAEEKKEGLTESPESGFGKEFDIQLFEPTIIIENDTDKKETLD